MKLQEFKEMHGIKSVEFKRFTEGKRMFATCLTSKGESISLYMSSKADLKQPLEVFKGAHDALWVGNASEALETVTL